MASVYRRALTAGGMIPTGETKRTGRTTRTSATSSDFDLVVDE